MATSVYTNNQYYSDIADAIRNKNGTNTQYKPSEMAPAINALVVAGGTINLQNKNVTPTEAAQNIIADPGYNGLGTVTVSAIPSQYIIPSGNKSITANGTGIDVTQYATVSVNVSSGGTTINNQNKTVTPTTSQQTITADSGYTGLGTVTVNAVNLQTAGIEPNETAQVVVPVSGYIGFDEITVDAIPSDYVGSSIDRRSSTDLTASGATVSVPAGYYETAASKSVTTMTLPTSVSTTSSGTSKLTITPTTANRYINIPTGYNGTASYYTISGDADLVAGNIKSGVQIFGVTGTYAGEATTPNLQAKTGINPSTFSQTIEPDTGYDGLSSVQINAMTAMTLPTAASSTRSGTTKATIGRSTSAQYINIPVGYNDTAASYTISAVANGSVTAPTSISGTTATVSTGTNTLTLTKTVSVTPNVTTAGYISAGTAGNSSVSLTANITTKAAATITPGTSNQTIASGTYLTGTQTISGDANLVAANIKSGVNIFNVSGTFTSDADATAADISAGKTAYVNGVKLTGTASGGGGADVPTFTAIWTDDYSSVVSVTCDKTFAECDDILESAGFALIVDNIQSGTAEMLGTATATGSDDSSLRYTVYFGGVYPAYDIVYYSNGTISAVSPSQMVETLNATTNGTYYPQGGIITEVNVNVPQPSGSINITQNGTHDVTNYASAVVNVSGGSSSWTKVAETSYQVSTTSTTAGTVATWATGHSELYTADKWVYVRIRDTAGKRDGYFFGSDQFFYNSSLANGSSPTYISTALRIYTRYSGTTITPTAVTGSNGNGVYADYLYSDGRIRIRRRYNSTSSLTIDGTYKVEVYLLDPAGGVPIFE